MDTAAHTGPDLRAGRREWMGLAVLALPTVLLAIDISVLYLALPHLSADLGPSRVQQLWILDIYGFLIAGFLITMGKLGDRIGRRRLMLIGAAAFGVASIVAAQAATPEMLIAARAVMGIAGATLMPSTLALIRTMFRNPKQMGVAIGVWSSCFVAGAAAGPLLGGALLTTFWWGSVFLVNVPIMALLLITGPRLLPEIREPDAGRIDITSVTLSLAAILPFIYAIKELAKSGWMPVPTVSLIVGAAFGVIFVLRQRRLASPLLDLRLFGHRGFSVSMCCILLAYMAVSALMLFMTQFLQIIEDLTPLRAGLWLLPGAAVMIASSMVAPLAAQRVRPSYLIAAGMAVSLIGLVLLTQITRGVVPLVAAQALISLGMGPLFSLGNNLIIGSAPAEKAGSAASMSETTGEVASALGIAVLGTVGTTVYTAHMADTIPPRLPEPAAQTARETLAGAATVAKLMPDFASELTSAAHAAFIAGMHVTAIISAILMAIVAVIVLGLLRHIGPIHTATPTATATEPTGNATTGGSHEATGATAAS